MAFGHVGLDWQKYVVQDPALVRPAEVDLLIGDPTKARQRLGWRPRVGFHELVRRMVEADLERWRGRRRAAAVGRDGGARVSWHANPRDRRDRLRGRLPGRSAAGDGGTRSGA